MILPIVNSSLNTKSFQKREISNICNNPKITVNNRLTVDDLYISLQNYNFASKYYNDRLNNNLPLIENFDLLSKVLSNNKAKQVLFTFFAERAKSEAKILKQKKNLTDIEKQQIIAYEEIINSFSSINEYKSPHEISFKSGNINRKPNTLTSEQRKKSHFIIHGASAACGGISAAMGEGAAVGADTPLLMGIQYGMFRGLQEVLGITMLDHINYIIRQYMMGHILGIQGAKILISWLGIAGHASSGGTASVPVTAGVRAINATLSTALTEKMGWGYISTYEKDNMKFIKQGIQTAIYCVGASLFGQGAETVLDYVNPDHIQTALEAIPQDNLSAMGNVIRFLNNNIHGDRFAFMFVADVAQKVLFAKDKTTKEEIKNSIKTALLNTIIFDLIDYGYGEVITEDTQKTVNRIAEEFKNNPSVWKEFENSQQKMFAELDLDNLSVHEFQQKFKDKRFIYTLTMISREATREVTDKWKKRNFVKLRQERNDVVNGDTKVKKHSNVIDNKISSNDITEIALFLEQIKQDVAQKKINVNHSNIGLAKIAGYDSTKKILNNIYLLPCSIEQCGNKVEIPGAILFYGPSGTGKTTLGRAIAEEGSRLKMPKRSIDIRNCKQLTDWLKETGEDAQVKFEKDNRRTVVQLNEFSKFENASDDEINNFLEFIKTCSEKYHMTLFLTTNNPLNIDKRILKLTRNIPLGVANVQDAISILKYYLKDQDTKDVNFDIIANKITSQMPDKYYSNAQFKQIAQFLPCSKVTTGDIINIMKKIVPLINKENLDKFEEEKKILNPPNLIEVR